MAVYGHSYRGYSGPLTAERARLLVIPRYALGDLFNSKFFWAFFVVCFVPPLVASIRIYLAHNAEAINILKLPQSVIDQLLGITPSFFRNWVLIPQSIFAFLMTLFIGPALISPDLRNNAMPLYLARPIFRSEYVLGKLIVLTLLLSAITWVPALALFAFQSFLAGFEWFGQNYWIAGSLLLAAAAEILGLAFVALAISAVVRWKPGARLLFFALPSVLSAVGGVLNLVFRTSLGDLLMFPKLLQSQWDGLLGLPIAPEDLAPLSTWAVLFIAILLSIAILAKKIRAYEVER